MVKTTRILKFYVGVLLLIFVPQARAHLLINEFMATNRSYPVGSPGDFDDWIELYNDSNESIDVAGLYLTDDMSNPTQWQFPLDRPRVTTLRPHEYLIVMADNDLEAPGFHANFRLASEGEQIGLFDADGRQLLDSVTFGPQMPDLSYGRDPQAPMTWRFLAWPSPGTANLPAYLGTVTEPVFSHERGFYEASFGVTLTCDTPDVTITYTLDGTDPLQGSGPGVKSYTGPIAVTKTTCLRAVAMKPGWMPSRVVSHTFLYRLSDRQKSLPVISLVGSPGETFYAPNGIMAIVGGQYSGGVWTKTSANSYNNVLVHGLERPVSLEIINPNGGDAPLGIFDFQTDCGIRVHGSDWMRPRYQNSSKYSFRLYFRNDYGLKELDYPLFPFDAKPLKSLVLRGGHNDQSNPFIKDELVRRLLSDMGHVSSRGTFANVFINGQYKGYFNPCEHITEAFCQAWFGSSEEWDIITMSGGIREGDRDRVNALMQYVRTHDLSIPEVYAEVDRQVDIVEFIDYLILRLWSGDWDWPHNNWSAASERSDQGQWRFFVWDAEGSMFPDQINNVVYDALHNNNHENATLYNALYQSPRFRAIFGDRIQAHFFGQGVLTEAHIKARFAAMQEELRGVIPNMDMYAINTWVPKRHTIFLDASKKEGVFTVEGPMPFINGEFQTQAHVNKGDQLFLLNPNASGTIYYTLDGSDPMEHAAVDDWDSVTMVSVDAQKRVFVPEDGSVTGWAGSDFFDDSKWLSVSGLPGGIGYERGTGYAPYLSLDIESAMQGSTGCYIRIPFIASRGLNAYDVMSLRVQYDDGFVAYLNGYEVARRNAAEDPAWNAAASASQDDSAAILFETIDVTQFMPYLQRAENMLAIHGLNVSQDSSDFLINAELIAGRGTPVEIDEDLLTYDGSILLTESAHIKARILRDSTWSSLTDMTFALQSVVEGLRITEIMYHPFETGHPDDPNTEYLELTNISDEPIPLGMVRFTQGVTLDLPALDIAPNDIVLVVKDSIAFENRYGPDLPVIGQYTGSLSNSGEWITLRDATDQIIHRIEYRDDWYAATDGEGYSLVLKNTAQTPSELPTDPDLWYPSALMDGTPGWMD
ncbi:MAG: CotH kinase family protein [Phycisphaerae bacterium]|nr:CotH kinase family protein [Phycisphaerae bacterium]